MLLCLLDESWTPTMSSYKTASVSGRSIDFCLFCRLAFNSHVKALSFSTTQFVIYEVDYSRDLILLKSSLHLCVHACLHAQLLSCVSLCNPMDCIPPGSSVPGISHARILEWIAISYSGGSSQARDWNHISWIAGRFFTTEPPGKPLYPETNTLPEGKFLGRLELSGYTSSSHFRIQRGEGRHGSRLSNPQKENLLCVLRYK